MYGKNLLQGWTETTGNPETSQTPGGTLGGGGIPIDVVLRAATVKVNSQAEIFSMVNSQATISF